MKETGGGECGGVLFRGSRGEGGRRGDSEADEGRQAGGGVMRAEQRRLAAGGKRSEVKHERIHHEASVSKEKTP